MYLELTEEQQFIQQTAARFAADELLPVAEILDRGEGRDLLLTNLQKLANLGFMGLNIDSDYGGTEAGSVAFSVALTELGRGCASTAVTVSVTNMVAEVIQACGTEQQKQHYLPKLCSGEYPAGAFCLTESGAGSDPAGMKCRATKEGNDWLLNGTKLYITSAEFA
jgi:alkylation response protein AidB-like acyl-CoA dehydrogenase